MLPATRIVGRAPMPHVFDMRMVTGPVFRDAIRVVETYRRDEPGRPPQVADTFKRASARRDAMRSTVVILCLVAAIAFVPAAAAYPHPGCDGTLRVEDVCDVYAAADGARACVKDLRWCIIGPI